MAATELNAEACGSMGCRCSVGLARVEIEGRGTRVLCVDCRSEVPR